MQLREPTMMSHFVDSVDSGLGHGVHGLLVQLVFQASVQRLECVVYNSPYNGVVFLRHEDARLMHASVCAALLALLLQIFVLRGLVFRGRL